MRFSFAICVAAAMPFLLAATEPMRLEPSGKWVIDYADNSCILSRTFGTGTNLTKLQIESGSPGSFNMLILGVPVESRSDEVPQRFLPLQAKAMMGKPVMSALNVPGVLWSNVPILPDAEVAKRDRLLAEVRRKPKVRPPATSLAEQAEIRSQRAAFSAGITAVEIEPRRNHRVSLTTGSLGPAIKILEKCNRDSLADWGVDVKIEDQIVRPAWPSRPGLGLSSYIYPKKMLAIGAQSDVTVRVLVDANGKVTKCTAFSRFDSPEFVDTVCAVVNKNAQFAPAELADGTKVPSYFSTVVSFVLK